MSLIMHTHTYVCHTLKALEQKGKYCRQYSRIRFIYVHFSNQFIQIGPLNVHHHHHPHSSHTYKCECKHILSFYRFHINKIEILMKGITKGVYTIKPTTVDCWSVYGCICIDASYLLNSQHIYVGCFFLFFFFPFDGFTFGIHHPIYIIFTVARVACAHFRCRINSSFPLTFVHF